jgi:hypothetical protein
VGGGGDAWTPPVFTLPRENSNSTFRRFCFYIYSIILFDPSGSGETLHIVTLVKTGGGVAGSHKLLMKSKTSVERACFLKSVGRHSKFEFPLGTLLTLAAIEY